ncbi:MAG TPA: DUF2207 domain-containing protein [Longimicrobiales bacterium]|nr:DUF2207 domain-containing protein [Longimicrobiales bacterium]
MTRTVAVLVLLLAAAVAPAAAQERIRSYDSEVEVRADGSLIVTEHIVVRAEGSQIRRGIYRDFPTRYRDRYGNRVRVDLEVLGVERNGQPEAWFTERMSNGIRINTGGDDFLPVPAEYTFTLRYRTTRQLGFFADHDELYWNAIGTGWVFPIEAGTVDVRLPAPVPVESMSAEGYTGTQGLQGTAWTAALPEPGRATYRLTQALSPYEGFTIVLMFPKGLVDEPTRAQRAAWLLADNRGVLVALAGLLLLLVFAVRRWHRVGRDPRRGVIIPRYEPPDGHTPGGLRYVTRMGYDPRCFSADVLGLAVAGLLRIHCDQRRLRSDEWRLERDEPGQPDATPQAALLAGLFPGRSQSLVLRNTNATTVSGAQQAHTKAFDQQYQPHYFERNQASVYQAMGIVIATGILAFLVAGGTGVPLIIAVLVLMLGTVVVFANLVRAPTDAGRSLLDEIEGLKLYLGVAERDDIARVPGPDAPPLLDAQRYETLLPYAVALEVEDAWTRKFTAAAGAAAAAAAAAGMTWYRGSRPISDMGSFSRAVGSSLSSQIASSSSPPGSSSGGGGGGSSGGGGGGGGGGGR